MTITHCDTCTRGCLCDQRDPQAGCGHYACWGPRAGEQERCPAADAYRVSTTDWFNAPLIDS